METTKTPCSQLSPSERAVRIRCIREEITARANFTSLRRVAREVGMSHSGVKKFCDGAEPYSKTVHRLRVWAARYMAADDSNEGRAP